MIHFIDKVLENLQSYIPLMQTLVWPVFLVILCLLFRRQVEACIVAIRKRIEEGSSIKAGPIEIGPATPKEQAEKLEQEIAESSPAPQTDETSEPTSSSRIASARDFRASYMLAEELVIKKLSADLSLKVQREVRTSGPIRFIFDGVAIVDQKFIGIEVKYLRNRSALRMMAERSLDRINTYYTTLAEDARKHFSIILAVVIDKDYEGTTEDVGRSLNRLKEQYTFPLHLTAYRMSDLEQEFGITKPNNTMDSDEE